MKSPRFFRAAERHLIDADPVMKRIITSHGRCTLKVDGTDLFSSLIRIVVSQQISGKAARAISSKIEKRFAKTGLTPKAILRARNETLKACGLSAGKARTIKAIAKAIIEQQLDIERLPQLENEAVAEQLLPIVGIGPWSVDMVLMFVLGRPDVLPVGDFGLRSAVKRHYELKELPKADHVTTLAEPWRPYRSIATWYLWRSLGPVPQSE